MLHVRGLEEGSPDAHEGRARVEVFGVGPEGEGREGRVVLVEGVVYHLKHRRRRRQGPPGAAAKGHRKSQGVAGRFRMRCA